MFVSNPLHQPEPRFGLGRERMGVVHDNRNLSLTLEERRTVETLVFERKPESIDNFWNGRIAGPALIIVVDNIIIVQISVFNIARL